MSEALAAPTPAVDAPPRRGTAIRVTGLVEDERDTFVLGGLGDDRAAGR